MIHECEIYLAPIYVKKFTKQLLRQAAVWEYRCCRLLCSLDRKWSCRFTQVTLLS